MVWDWKYCSALALFVKLLCLGDRLMNQYHDGDRSAGRLHHQVRHNLAAKAAAIGITDRCCIRQEGMTVSHSDMTGLCADSLLACESHEGDVLAFRAKTVA